MENIRRFKELSFNNEPENSSTESSTSSISSWSCLNAFTPDAVKCWTDFLDRIHEDNRSIEDYECRESRNEENDVPDYEEYLDHLSSDFSDSFRSNESEVYSNWSVMNEELDAWALSTDEKSGFCEKSLMSVVKCEICETLNKSYSIGQQSLACNMSYITSCSCLYQQNLIRTNAIRSSESKLSFNKVMKPSLPVSHLFYVSTANFENSTLNCDMYSSFPPLALKSYKVQLPTNIFKGFPGMFNKSLCVPNNAYSREEHPLTTSCSYLQPRGSKCTLNIKNSTHRCPRRVYSMNPKQITNERHQLTSRILNSTNNCMEPHTYRISDSPSLVGKGLHNHKIDCSGGCKNGILDSQNKKCTNNFCQIQTDSKMHAIFSNLVKKDSEIEPLFTSELPKSLQLPERNNALINYIKKHSHFRERNSECCRECFPYSSAGCSVPNDECKNRHTVKQSITKCIKRNTFNVTNKNKLCESIENMPASGVYKHMTCIGQDFTDISDSRKPNGNRTIHEHEIRNGTPYLATTEIVASNGVKECQQSEVINKFSNESLSGGEGINVQISSNVSPTTSGNIKNLYSYKNGRLSKIFLNNKVIEGNFVCGDLRKNIPEEVNIDSVYSATVSVLEDQKKIVNMPNKHKSIHVFLENGLSTIPQAKVENLSNNVCSNSTKNKYDNISVEQNANNIYKKRWDNMGNIHEPLTNINNLKIEMCAQGVLDEFSVGGNTRTNTETILTNTENLNTSSCTDPQVCPIFTSTPVYSEEFPQYVSKICNKKRNGGCNSDNTGVEANECNVQESQKELLNSGDSMPPTEPFDFKSRVTEIFSNLREKVEMIGTTTGGISSRGENLSTHRVVDLTSMECYDNERQTKNATLVSTGVQTDERYNNATVLTQGTKYVPNALIRCGRINSDRLKIRQLKDYCKKSKPARNMTLQNQFLELMVKVRRVNCMENKATLMKDALIESDVKDPVLSNKIPKYAEITIKSKDNPFNDSEICDLKDANTQINFFKEKDNEIQSMERNKSTKSDSSYDFSEVKQINAKTFRESDGLKSINPLRLDTSQSILTEVPKVHAKHNRNKKVQSSVIPKTDASTSTTILGGLKSVRFKKDQKNILANFGRTSFIPGDKMSDNCRTSIYEKGTWTSRKNSQCDSLLGTVKHASGTNIPVVVLSHDPKRQHNRQNMPIPITKVEQIIKNTQVCQKIDNKGVQTVPLCSDDDGFLNKISSSDKFTQTFCYKSDATDTSRRDSNISDRKLLTAQGNDIKCNPTSGTFTKSVQTNSEIEILKEKVMCSNKKQRSYSSNRSNVIIMFHDLKSADNINDIAERKDKTIQTINITRHASTSTTDISHSSISAELSRNQNKFILEDNNTSKLDKAKLTCDSGMGVKCHEMSKTLRDEIRNAVESDLKTRLVGSISKRTACLMHLATLNDLREKKTRQLHSMLGSSKDQKRKPRVLPAENKAKRNDATNKVMAKMYTRNLQKNVLKDDDISAARYRPIYK